MALLSQFGVPLRVGDVFTVVHVCSVTCVAQKKLPHGVVCSHTVGYALTSMVLMLCKCCSKAWCAPGAVGYAAGFCPHCTARFLRFYGYECGTVTQRAQQGGSGRESGLLGYD
jgi:hypothetical protein